MTRFWFDTPGCASGWAARCKAIDEERARSWFERSYAGFAAAGDASGMRIAAASVVIAFVIEYGDIRTLETWLRRHVEAGGEHPVEQGSAHEATLCMGVICAALNAGAHPATIDANAVTRRLQVLLDDPSVWLTRDQAVEAARLLVDHARVFAKREQAQSNGPGNTATRQRCRRGCAAAGTLVPERRQRLFARRQTGCRGAIPAAGARSGRTERLATTGVRPCARRRQCRPSQGGPGGSQRASCARSKPISLSPRPPRSVRSTRVSRHGRCLPSTSTPRASAGPKRRSISPTRRAIGAPRRAYSSWSAFTHWPPTAESRRRHNWRGRWRRGCKARNSSSWTRSRIACDFLGGDMRDLDMLATRPAAGRERWVRLHACARRRLPAEPVRTALDASNPCRVRAADSSPPTRLRPPEGARSCNGRGRSGFGRLADSASKSTTRLTARRARHRTSRWNCSSCWCAARQCAAIRPTSNGLRNDCGRTPTRPTRASPST